jgi:hypothetical protein
MTLKQEQLQNTNTLIGRYQDVLRRPAISDSLAIGLEINLRSLQKLAARLESDLAIPDPKETQR